MTDNILELTRQAFYGYLLPNCGAANLLIEKASADKNPPTVNIGASNADEDPPLSGNFWVDVEIIVKTSAFDTTTTDPKTDSDSLERTVYEALEVTDLPSQLSSQGVTNYTVMGLGEQKSFNQDQDGDCWVTTWKRRIYCGRF